VIYPVSTQQNVSIFHQPDVVKAYSHTNFYFCVAHKLHQTNHCIGSEGKFGKILIRGSHGHDIIDELQPLAGEPIIDKPGKGSFWATDLHLVLQSQHITTLFVCGVTTEVCVHTTVREANDRGYHCIVVEDCCASYFPKFHAVAIEMIWAQGGIFGSVIDSQTLINALSSK
jgi:biuret amidohydrolase